MKEEYENWTRYDLIQRLRDQDKLIKLMNGRTKLLRLALEQIRDFDDNSEWDDPGQIAIEALTIK